MGIKYTHPGDFSTIRNAVRMAAPANARALFLAGETIGETAKNWAGTVDGTWVGIPTIAAGYISIDGGTQSLETGVIEPADFTGLFVVKTPDIVGGDSPYIMSTNTGTASIGGASIFGASLFINNASDGRWTFTSTRYNAGVNSLVGANLSGANIPTVGEWTLIQVRMDATRIEIKDVTRAKVNTITTALARNPTINGVRIGAKRGVNTTTGTLHMNCGAFWGAWKSDVDMALMATQFRAIAANDGITV